MALRHSISWSVSNLALTRIHSVCIVIVCVFTICTSTLNKIAKSSVYSSCCHSYRPKKQNLIINMEIQISKYQQENLPSDANMQ